MIKLHLSQQDIYFDQVLDSKNSQYNIGNNNPISDEHTEEGRKQNRRVEIIILKL